MSIQNCCTRSCVEIFSNFNKAVTLSEMLQFSEKTKPHYSYLKCASGDGGAELEVLTRYCANSVLLCCLRITMLQLHNYIVTVDLVITL